MKNAKIIGEIALDVTPQVTNFVSPAEDQNVVVSSVGEIFSARENVHFRSGNPPGTDIELAAKWTLPH
jgi:hypothetical protein